MAVITKQELEDAAADAFALEKVVNGSPTEGGTGIVSTRLGQQIKTLAKVILDLSTTDIGTSAQAAINRYIVEGTATQSGPARALIGNSITPALSRGTYTTGNNGYLATVTGWRCAFKHNGSNFDTAQLTFKTITSAADVVVEIYSTDGTTILAKGLAKGTTTLKTHTVVFDRVVSGIAADTILYIAYRTVNRTVQVSYPGGGTYESGVDNAVYREAYTQATEGVWTPVTTPSASVYMIPFRLFNLSDFSRSFSDELTALNTQVGGATGKINLWPDPYFRLIDPTKAEAFLSKDRWWGGNGAAWNLIPNPVFSGRAMQRVATAQASPMCGPVLHLDEINANPGDVVTVRALVTGNGAVAGLYAREDSGSDSAWTGGQLSFVKSDGTGTTGTTTSTPVLMTLEFTVSAGTKRLALYYTHTGTTGQTFELVALWGFKGAAATGPTTPSVLDEIQTYNDVLARLEVPPELILPPAVYGVQGREFNLYFDNVVVGSAWDYNVDVNSVGSVGYHLDECWRWTPTGAVTTGDLTVSLSGRASGKQLVSGTTAQRSAASNAGSGTNKKIIYIGDSMVNAGVITQTLLDIAATDVMGVTLYGLRGSGANKHEGRGGWSIPDYSSYGRTAYQFTVSGITTTPTNGSTYTHNGSTYTVEWTNLSSGSGTITAFLTSGTATPLASGTLTKTGGTGDSTITFAASSAVSGNPFWIGGAVNFSGYLSAFSFPAPDWVFIALGINDVFGQTSDAAAASLAQSRFLQLETLIQSIKDADPNTRVGIVIPTPPTASQDAFGFNYTTGQTRWRDKRNVLIWGRELIAKFKGRQADRIYVVPSNVALDTVNNYDRSAPAPVNSRATSVLVSRQNNGVHPGATGYQQIGDAVWAFLKYFA